MLRRPILVIAQASHRFLGHACSSESKSRGKRPSPSTMYFQADGLLPNKRTLPSCSQTIERHGHGISLYHSLSRLGWGRYQPGSSRAERLSPGVACLQLVCVSTDGGKHGKI